jgi:hypothetical protein
VVSFAGQGEWLEKIQLTMRENFGIGTLIVPFLFISAGLMLTQLKWRITKPNVFLGSVLLFAAFLGLLKTGLVGQTIFLNLSDLVLPIGANLMLFSLGLVGIMVMTETSLDEMLLGLQKIFSFFGFIGKIVPQKSGSTFSMSRPGIKISGGQRNLEKDNEKENVKKKELYIK